MSIVHERFEGQVAVVTGAASGIGRDVTRRLLTEGARVVVWDSQTAPLAGAFGAGGRLSSVALDIGDASAVRAAGEAVVSELGRWDILVHCAGVVGPVGRPLVDVTIDELTEVMRINLLGSFLVTQQAARAMTARRYGRILLFSSIAGKEGNPGMSPYSASKAGVIGLVKAVGKELATAGVTVNAIAPGVVRTPLVEAMPSERVKELTDKIPMRRTGTLDEVTSLACWAVSPEASFTTGFTFDLSGGRATY